MNRTVENQSDCKNDQWFQKGCDKVRCYRKQVHFFPLFPYWVNFLELPPQKLWSSMKIVRRQLAWSCLWLGIWGRWSVSRSPPLQLQCRMYHVLHALGAYIQICHGYMREFWRARQTRELLETEPRSSYSSRPRKFSRLKLFLKKS